MATTRFLAIVGAASIAGLAIIQTPALARTNCSPTGCRQASSNAPLNLLPPAYRSDRSHRKAATKRGAKRSGRKAARRATTARHHRRAARRKIVYRSAHSPIPRPRPAIARAADETAQPGVSGPLLAMLPWWRAQPMQTIRYYGGEELESQVLAAADAWVAAHQASDAEADNENPRLARADGAGDTGAAPDAEDIDIVDAGELNAIDLAAGEPPPAEGTFVKSLIALLGGAVAAASAARFLLV